MISFRFRRFASDLPARRGMGRFAGWLSALREALDALVFPWLCPVCGDGGIGQPVLPLMPAGTSGTVGTGNVIGLPAVCLVGWPVRGFARRLRRMPGPFAGLRRIVRDGSYEGELQDLCLRLKHEQNAWLAPWLSDLFVEARHDAISHLPPDAWVVPVPLHWWRHWQRGYNQAEALARGLARRLNLPVHQPLRRVIATERLAHKGVPRGPRSCDRRSVPGPVVNSPAARCSWSTMF